MGANFWREMKRDPSASLRSSRDDNKKKERLLAAIAKGFGSGRRAGTCKALCRWDSLGSRP